MVFKIKPKVMKACMKSFLLLALFSLTVVGTSKAQTASSIIDEINYIFKYDSYYKLVWSYNSYTKVATYKGPSCTVSIPLSGANVYYDYAAKVTYKGKEYDTKEKYRLKFTTTSDITEDCTSSGKSTTRSTIAGLTDREKALKAKDLFQKLIDMSKPSSYSSSSSSGVKDLSYLKVNEDADLKYANAEFDRYNEYETQYYIDKSRGMFIHKNKFGYNEIPLSEAKAWIVKDKNWFVVGCKYYDECMTGRGKDGNGSSKMKEYSMSLTDGSGLVAHAQKVADALNASIARANGTTARYNRTVNRSSSSSLNQKDLDYANDEFRRYNKYGAQWSINADDKTVTLHNNFGDNTASIYDVEIVLVKEKNWFVIRCKNTNNKCIHGVSNDGDITDREEYSMSLPDDGGSKLIRHADEVARALQNAINSVK